MLHVSYQLYVCCELASNTDCASIETFLLAQMCLCVSSHCPGEYLCLCIDFVCTRVMSTIHSKIVFSVSSVRYHYL